MIISKIIGGLGNQMFQYAVGRALSLERNQVLYLDTMGFSNYLLHQGFELDRVFSCPTELATENNVISVLGWQSLPGIRRILARPEMTMARRKNFVIEPHFNYWSEIDHLPKNCYLSGYWQSERYFKSHAATIRSDLAFKVPLAGENRELSRQISQVNAVSLHVRRGDYARNPKTTATHGLCSLEYYRVAIQSIAKQVNLPHFYVFSDDMAWVKSNIIIDFPHQYIDFNHGLDSYIDMHLMSLCQHHILANSSFSWWGAWLNTNPDKLVVAPKKWFSNDYNTKDLLPEGWVTL